MRKTLVKILTLLFFILVFSCYQKSYQQQHKDKMFQGWEQEHKDMDKAENSKVKGPKH